jgi:hypothetical protein
MTLRVGIQFCETAPMQDRPLQWGLSSYKQWFSFVKQPHAGQACMVGPLVITAGNHETHLPWVMPWQQQQQGIIPKRQAPESEVHRV